ncbi:hypothetical protein PIB30_009726 [Stylosanthes scabra]|uniref:Uncharacterized protein n=1 Tax=Stylosanthes scabra TaxID=79078 RepID=A0ABU6W5X0_9FABA|nr:hypothetical protein [Stylosanthes scabra]
MAAFKFLISLPSGLPKRNKFTCRWILDISDAEVGKFLDDLLDVKMKRTKLDDLMAKMADPARMGPRPKQSSKRDRAKVVNLEDEEGLQEDPAADLQKKRRRKKVKVDEAFEKALGEDSAWEHNLDPLAVAFSESFNYRKALNAGLTSPSVGAEASLAAKVKAEKELSAALDQIEILKGERDPALSYLPFKEKADTLKDELSEKSLEHQSALNRIAQLEEDNRADLSKTIKASEYWRSEWQMLGGEVTEMCQETLDICLDQVSHLYPGIDFFAITLKSRWDPKGRRIFVPRESDEGEPSRITEVVPEQPPEPTVQATPSTAGDAAEVGGGCPT